MTTSPSLATALRAVRLARGLSQEAFSDVSSRTYLSALERNLKSPTINKLSALCPVLDIHPLTLLTLAYVTNDPSAIDHMLCTVRSELAALRSSAG